MLSNELMGVLALAILWVNTVLIAGAAWQERRRLRERLDTLRPLAPGELGAGVLEAAVTRGDGPDGRLAVRLVEQIGRSAGDHVNFSDKRYAGEVLGGALRAGDVEIGVPPRAEAEIWVEPSALEGAMTCPSAERFDTALAMSRKARGFARTVEAPVGVGERVWAQGELRAGEGGRPELVADASGRLMVGTLDPRAFCRSRAWLCVAFVLAELGVAAACTAVALFRPHFGPVSLVGGALCLVFFLLVQPAGTALREAVRMPHQRVLRGRWSRPGGPAVSGAEGLERSVA